VDDLIERYCAEHLPKLAARNAADQKSDAGQDGGPDLGQRKLVTEITPTDVDKLLNKIAEGRPRPHKEKPNNRARKLQGAKPTPVRANRIGEVLRKMFTWRSSGAGARTTPPSASIAGSRTARERFLSKEDPKLAAALDAAEDRRAADIIRMCMLTGARVGEVRQARFEQFNLEHMSWSKPPP
jgi:integrase